MKTVLSFLTICCLIINIQAQRTSKDLIKNLDISIPLRTDLQTNLATGSIKLNKHFKADDGSIVNIRQIEDKVYAIADRYDRRFSSIWVGKITGNTLKVNFYFIPKGKAKGSGVLTFKVSGSSRAQQLTLISSSLSPNTSTFNFKKLQTLSALPTKLPIDNRAWYRGDKLDNLTGRWIIKNVGKEYILDLGKQIITYTVGGRKTSHSRPQFTTLFIGERSGLTIKGYYVDLPYGHTSGVGHSSFKIVGPHFIKANYDHFSHGINRERAKEDIHEILN